MMDIELHKKWKNRYIVKWCELCDRASILCPDCKNISCNGGSCEKCKEDFIEFTSLKHSIENYLTYEEIKTYLKCLALKKYIVKTLRNGDKEIDWNKLDKEGELSEY